ncbi:hypothetical protein [Methylobacterium gnaphalii]|uniref:Uncharacterized protein n=1 Tax=Methylobacterium gnaphalii TaxID=1010610 RepID=A0A512JEI8_9HYPH|nr:hypothetical protein [Methylobacterium gnaphalii]GEP08364.1 hypothetical protein MGN01_02090 [Methylobacterium gnaphalii]GLS47943.1 hypothetical protein GCM10007885_07870 [Methylobacterium gnaphalii]
MTWRTPLRLALRYGLLFAGLVTVGYWVVASVGGNISRAGFALGVGLIVASFSARLVPPGR